jgi:hypothetical protein
MMKRTLVVLAALLVGAAALAQDRAPGEPIPGMDIKLGRKPPKTGTIVAEGKTDAQGSIRFADLPKGQYWVKVTINGQSWDVGTDDAGSAIELAGPATAPDGRAAQAVPAATKKFAKAVGGNTAAVEIGAEWLKVTLVRGAPIVTSRSNIK